MAMDSCCHPELFELSTANRHICNALFHAHPDFNACNNGLYGAKHSLRTRPTVSWTTFPGVQVEDVRSLRCQHVLPGPPPGRKSMQTGLSICYRSPGSADARNLLEGLHQDVPRCRV